MATTQEILDAAHALGKIISTHEVARKLEDAVGKLQGDLEAQRVMTDYQRFLNSLAEKESQGRPIEVADKKKLDDLQNQVIRNPLLRAFQMAQMDYLDLMRKVDAAISGESPEAPAPAAAPLINPDVSMGKA